MSNSTALVILSGGQDSVTCLGLALNNHETVHAVSFRYGQRHSVELECAEKLCKDYDVKHRIVDLSFLGTLVTSSLTGPGCVNDPHPANKDLPASFVPNRNALFITVAHAYAQEVKASIMYGGMCQTDYSGYPDCREEFIDSIMDSLNKGYLTSIAMLTPLMYLTKAQTFQAAEDCGFLDNVLNDSHTCYNGDHHNFHVWGYGCDSCGACEIRKKGYEEFEASKSDEG